MNRQKALKEYLSSKSLVGKRYEDPTIEMIVRRGLKHEISFFQNEELLKSLLDLKGCDISVDFKSICDVLEDLIECEKSAQMSKS